MTEHYRRGDPERGCGILLVGALIVVAAIAAGAILRLDALAVAFVAGTALVVYWLLSVFSRR